MRDVIDRTNTVNTPLVSSSVESAQRLLQIRASENPLSKLSYFLTLSSANGTKGTIHSLSLKYMIAMRGVGEKPKMDKKEQNAMRDVM